MNSPESPAPGSSGRMDLARQARLTLKEFRETLRDRRTIVTLILMPLLVYPLLSMTFQRMLVSGLTPEKEPLPLIAFENERDGEFFRSLMEIYRSQVTDQPSGGEDSEPGAARAEFDLRVAEDMPRAVADGTASLGLRRRPAREPSDGVTFELLHRPDSTGRRMVAEVESRLRAVHEAGLVSMLRQLGQTSQVTNVQRVALEMEEIGSPLATLVPLILILMTITGAVYPAIDLTAGERERGTLETLAASPMPPLAILLAKYCAVVCVAMLTATVNLMAMTVTIYFAGLGPLLFGDRGISPLVVAQVFGLLILFAMFFSAVLLSVTSFARSFKEAQAYLIPLMLVAIAPGLLSMTPGVELSGWLAVIPLVNIVLLTRDVFQGVVEPGVVTIAVITTLFYAVAAIGVAARVFSGDALLYGSDRAWSDLWRPEEKWSPTPAVGTVLFCTALLFPLQFVLGGIIAQFPETSMSLRLMATGIATVVLFAGLPLLAMRVGRCQVSTGLRLSRPHAVSWLAVPLLGVSLWPFALELFRFGSWLGLASVTEAHLEFAESLVREFQQIPGWLLVLALGVAPGFCEELFFRGFLFSGLRRHLRAGTTLVVTSVLFGLFHLVTPSMLATERLIPTTFLGFALGWVSLRTGSVLPGMLIHATHNSLLVLFSRQIGAVGWESITSEVAQFSLPWLGLAFLGVLLGLLCVEVGTGILRGRRSLTSQTDSEWASNLR